MMNRKFFMRLMGAAACVAAFAASNEAEAGRWHRRHCCEPVCCEPVRYEPVCCEPVRVSECVTSCCAPACETVAWYDSCGRLVYRRAACCETVVSTRIVVPATTCCTIASNGSPAETVAAAPAKEAVAAKTVSIVK